MIGAEESGRSLGEEVSSEDEKEGGGGGKGKN